MLPPSPDQTPSPRQIRVVELEGVPGRVRPRVALGSHLVLPFDSSGSQRQLQLEDDKQESGQVQSLNLRELLAAERRQHLITASEQPSIPDFESRLQKLAAAAETKTDNTCSRSVVSNASSSVREKLQLQRSKRTIIDIERDNMIRNNPYSNPDFEHARGGMGNSSGNSLMFPRKAGDDESEDSCSIGTGSAVSSDDDWSMYSESNLTNAQKERQRAHQQTVNTLQEEKYRSRANMTDQQAAVLGGVGNLHIAPTSRLGHMLAAEPKMVSSAIKKKEREELISSEIRAIEHRMVASETASPKHTELPSLSRTKQQRMNEFSGISGDGSEDDTAQLSDSRTRGSSDDEAPIKPIKLPSSTISGATPASSGTQRRQQQQQQQQQQFKQQFQQAQLRRRASAMFNNSTVVQPVNRPIAPIEVTKARSPPQAQPTQSSKTELPYDRMRETEILVDSMISEDEEDNDTVPSSPRGRPTGPPKAKPAVSTRKSTSPPLPPLINEPPKSRSLSPASSSNRAQARRRRSDASYDSQSRQSSSFNRDHDSYHSNDSRSYSSRDSHTKSHQRRSKSPSHRKKSDNHHSSFRSEAYEDDEEDDSRSSRSYDKSSSVAQSESDVASRRTEDDGRSSFDDQSYASRSSRYTTDEVKTLEDSMDSRSTYDDVITSDGDERSPDRPPKARTPDFLASAYLDDNYDEYRDRRSSRNRKGSLDHQSRSSYDDDHHRSHYDHHQQEYHDDDMSHSRDTDQDDSQRSDSVSDRNTNGWLNDEHPQSLQLHSNATLLEELFSNVFDVQEMLNDGNAEAEEDVPDEEAKANKRTALRESILIRGTGAATIPGSFGGDTAFNTNDCELEEPDQRSKSLGQALSAEASAVNGIADLGFSSRSVQSSAKSEVSTVVDSDPEPSVKGDSGTNGIAASKPEKIHVRLINQFLRLSCALSDWNDVLLNAEEFVNGTLADPKEFVENEDDIQEVLRQAQVMKTMIADHDTMLHHASPLLLRELFPLLKECVLQFVQDNDMNGSVISNNTHGMTEEAAEAMGMLQMEKQIDVFAKFVIYLSGFCMQPDDATPDHEKHRITFYTLLELLQMTITLNCRQVQSGGSASVFSTTDAISSELLKRQHWTLSSCLRQSWYKARYMKRLERLACKTDKAGSNGTSVSKASFRVADIERLSYMILKDTLVSKFAVHFDGRRSRRPIHHSVKASLFDLYMLCGCPSDVELVAPVPRGAQQILTKLKIKPVERNGLVDELWDAIEDVAEERTKQIQRRDEAKQDDDEDEQEDIKGIFVLSSACSQSDEASVLEADFELDGTSGWGKTVFAASFVSRDDVRRFYRGGVVWLEFGVAQHEHGAMVSPNATSLSYTSYCNFLQSICLQLDQNFESSVPEFCRFVPQPDDDEHELLMKKRHNMIKAKHQMEEYLEQRITASSSSDESLLIVLDNLSCASDMEWFQFKYESGLGMHLIVTTRNAISPGKIITVGPMLEDEAAKLIIAETSCDRISNDEINLAKELAHECKRHPMTLTATGRWIQTANQKRKNKRTTTADNMDHVFDLIAKMDRRPETPLLFQIFDAALEESTNQHVAPVLKVCVAALVVMFRSEAFGIGATADVTLGLIKAFWSAIFHGEDLDDVLEDLFSAKQRRDEGKDAFDLVLEHLEHLGIVDVVKAAPVPRIPDNRYIVSFKHEMCRLYGDFLSKGKGSLDSVAEDSVARWNATLVHHYLEVTETEEAQLAGSIFDECEDYVIVMLPTHMSRAGLLHEMEQMLGDDVFIHKRLMSLGCDLGTIIHVQDCRNLFDQLTLKFDSASEASQQIVSIYEKVAVSLGQIMARGEDYESESLILDVVQAMHQMGHSLFEMDCSSQAFKYYKTSREILKYNKAGEKGEHELVAASRYSLGLIHMKADRNKKAMASFEQSLKVWESHIGAENEYTAQIHEHMGTIQALYGYYRKALVCYDHAHRIRSAQDDKVGVSRTLAKIGHIFHKNGQLDRAVECYMEAMNINEQTVEKNGLELSVTWNRIGNIHTIKGEYEKAMECFEKSLQLRGLSLDDDDLDVADTLQNIAILCHFKGEFEDALQCFQKAMKIYTDNLGDTHFKVGDSLYNMGSLYVDMSDYESAQTSLEQALRIRKLSLHADHVDVADTLHLLGLVLVNLGDRLNALPCFREALRIRKLMLGSGNPLVGDSLNTLGVFYKEINMLDKAAEYISKELKLRKKQLGEDHMHVGDTLHLLGTIEMDRGNFEQAIAYFEESLRIKTSHVGEEHLDVADTLSELAVVHAEMDKYESSIALMEKCLKIRSKQLDNENSDSLMGDTYLRIGKIHAQFENFEEALKLFEKALNARREDDVASAEILHSMGCLYDDMDDEDRALELYLQALQLRKTHLGDDHEDLAESYAKIGNIRAQQGEYEDAMKDFLEMIRISNLPSSENCKTDNFLLDKADILHKMAIIHNINTNQEAALNCEKDALAIFKAKLGEQDKKVSDALHNIGCYLSLAGRCEESLGYFEEAFRLRKILNGRNHEDVATTLYNSASSHNMMGNHDKALKCLKEALEIRQKTLGQHHEKVTATLQRIAGVCREIGDFKEAIRTYEEILPGLVEQVGKNDLRVATIYHSLGNLEDDQGNYEKAMAYFEEALRIRRVTLGEGHEEVATCLSSIAFVRSNMGDEDGALQYLNEALVIRMDRLGDDHELVGDTHNNLAYFHCALGNRDKARHHLWEALTIRKLCKADQKVADTLNNLGNVHKDMGEYDLAIECYQEALRVRERSQIEGIGDTYFNLGDLYVLKNDLESATECYEESLRIRTLKLGKDHLKVADGHLNMVDVHLKRGEHNMALLRLEEVLRIKRLKLGNNSEDVANTIYSIGIVYNAKKDVKMALQKFEEALSVFIAAGCPSEHPQVATLMRMIKLLEQRKMGTKWPKF